jgi:hypothetical protein
VLLLLLLRCFVHVGLHSSNTAGKVQLVGAAVELQSAVLLPLLLLLLSAACRIHVCVPVTVDP